MGKKACWSIKIGWQNLQPVYLWSCVLDECPSRIYLHSKIMFSRLSGLELYVSKTIFDLNMATSVCFYRKTMWQIFLLKSRFLTFFHFYCQWERLNFAWKAYFNIWYSQRAAPRVEQSFGPNNSCLYNFICMIYHILQFL